MIRLICHRFANVYYFRDLGRSTSVLTPTCHGLTDLSLAHAAMRGLPDKSCAAKGVRRPAEIEGAVTGTVDDADVVLDPINVALYQLPQVLRYTACLKPETSM